MKTQTWILLLGSLLIGSLVYGQNEMPMQDVAGFKKDIAQFARDTRTIQADFVQEKQLSFLEDRIVSKGHFTFLREKNLRWAYTEPFQYLIILREGEVLLKDGDKVNTFRTGDSRLFGQINDIMLLLVRGQLPSEEDFGQEFYENNQHYILELQPKSRTLREFLKKVVIHFDRERLLVDEIRMVEPSEDFTHIRFSNRKLNGPVAREMFELN